MTSLLLWVIRKLGWQALLSLLLLIIIVAAVAFGLDGVVRGLDGPLMFEVGLVALLIGWLLARSPFPGWLGAALGAIIGLEFILVRVGQLGERLFGLLGDLLALAWSLAGFLTGPPTAAHATSILRQVGLVFNALVKSGIDLLNAVVTLFLRWEDWGVGVAQGRGRFDPVAAALMWSALVWVVIIWAAWGVRRRERPFEAVLPAMILLAGTLAYTGRGATLLLALLTAGLLLMALVNYTAREHRWRTNRIGFSEEIRTDVATMVLPVIAGLVILAAWIPPISVHDVVESVQRMTREQAPEVNRATNSLGLEAAPLPTTVFESVRAPGLPNEHLIGESPELAKRVVMRIKTNDVHSAPPTGAATENLPRYYWRTANYDLYFGRGWYTGWTEILDLKPNQPVTDPRSMAGHLVEQTVQFVEPPTGQLYTVGTLVSADHNYRVARRGAGDLFSANIQATTYRATSLIVTPTEAELEKAGTDYPDWVVRTYLQLPDTLPARVLTLARDLTATSRTPYDRARAIEAYLRTYPYTLDVPLPPTNRDVVDYFLFDLKRGYCDYYASAMVVLARAAGLPARLVVGYASGTFEPLSATFNVTEADAHAWPEVYFPNYGWVEFEPTAGRVAIQRDAEATRSYPPPVGQGATGATTGEEQPGRNDWVLWLAGLFAVALAATGLSALDEWRLSHLAPARTLQVIYGRVSGHARRLGVDTNLANTPFQTVAAFDARLHALASPRPRSTNAGREALVQQASYQLRMLAESYVAARYSAQSPDAMTQARAIQAWGQLRGLLWRAWLWQLFDRSRSARGRSVNSPA